MRRIRAGYLFWAGAVCVGAILARLIAIDQPFIDSWSWRQADVAAIARNYWQGGFHFAYPQIDWAGPAAGYVGSEFPILPFLAAVSYLFTGVHEWIGRSESLLFFALSLPFFAGLVSDIFGKTASVWALIFYAFMPLSIMASRSFIPDMPSLALCIVGLYCCRRWLQGADGKMFVAAALAISLALLVKLPSAITGAPLACLVFERHGIDAFRRRSLWLLAAIVLVPSALWYWHAWRISRDFYPNHFFGAGGLQIMSLDWYWGIAKRIVDANLTIVPIILAVAGLVIARKQNRSNFFEWWLGVMILFIIVVGYGNRHPWYQLPLVPVAAAFAGCAMARFTAILQSRRMVFLALGALILGCFAVQSYGALRYFYRPAAADLRNLGLALKSHTPPDSLVVIPDYGDPTALYYGERKGWHFAEKNAIYNGHPRTSAEAIADLEQLRRRGATHIAFYSESIWWFEYYPEFAQHLDKISTPIATTPAYHILELQR